MERIHGIPVTDVKALEQQNTNMQALAERGVEIFFTQVFRDSFFHADMHPGNIFVSKQNPEKPQYIAIDCAIIGSLSESDQYYMARNLLAIFQRDYRLVAELHIECGWIPAETNVHEFESVMRSVCEPVFEKPLAEISFGQLLVSLFETARRFEMEVQPSLVLLQKTLLNIEGLGRELYPQLNLWDTAQPFLEKWIKDRYAPSGVYKRLRKHIPAFLEQLPHLPETLLESLNQPKQLPANKDQAQRLQRLEQALESQRNRSSYLIIGLIALLAITNPQVNAALAQLPVLGWAAIIILLLWLRR